jgi:hypothetical protein
MAALAPEFPPRAITADLSTSRSRLGETAPVEIRGYGLGGIPHFALLRIEHPGFVALH